MLCVVLKVITQWDNFEHVSFILITKNEGTKFSIRM